ncbi:Uu.00g035540.m01.CDS01 [Anthostomella pinea]|uniref:Uu.00g035540.m01.CDS01 n=1 Tax=Anthostomella pinea TaxID=933095 RepID=A0AAI8YDD5_9PEZI|nr:Uu.00g035540.m01.CDS01 [Anthostomella pinea]
MAEYENEAPTGDVADDSYVSRPGHKNDALPVISDQERVEDPIDDRTADTDEQLRRDDKEAIDESNIIGGRTRGAKPVASYREPGDVEGLPANDGTSSTS